MIHDLEESAEPALIFTLIASCSALISLVFNEKFLIVKNHSAKTVIILSLIAVGTLISAASMGGKIRHPELDIGSTLRKEYSNEHNDYD